MKYVAPIAERVDVEALSVILTSGDEGCTSDSTTCANQGSGTGWFD